MSDDLLALPRVDATPAGVTLGCLTAIADGTARGFVLRIGATRFHGLVVRRGGQAHGYVDRCPHAGLPLARGDATIVTADGTLIECHWHGALFEVESGSCVGGPCVGARLTPWAVSVRDGLLVTD